MYGIVCGWDDECFKELSPKFGWTPEGVARLKRLRVGFVAESDERLARLERRAKDWAKSKQATVNVLENGAYHGRSWIQCEECNRDLIQGQKHAHDCDAAIILDLKRESVR